jgi:acyl-CoA thioesterase-1
MVRHSMVKKSQRHALSPDRRDLIAAGSAALALAVMPAARAQARPLTVVALGDSLTAGYQLPQQAAFPAVLERRLKADGMAVTISNAGVSGDTASGGRDRLDWAVGEDADAVIVALGANDALRGLDPAIPRAALDDIVSRLRARRIGVFLVGMVAPPNNGPDYGRRFNAIYPELAAKHGVPLYPFFLDGVAANPALNLSDGIHPNTRGVEMIVERMAPAVASFLRALPRRG